jgi:hypothetical protein
MMRINLRAARADDLLFCRQLYYETMRSIIERLFGWDQAREDSTFATQFKSEEVEIILVDGRDPAGSRRNAAPTRSRLASFMSRRRCNGVASEPIFCRLNARDVMENPSRSPS